MGSLVSDVTNSVGGLFGGAPNNSGTTAQAAPLIQPVTGAQVQNAQGQALGGINQQQALTNALATQGTQGINTQSNLTEQLTNEANGQGPNPAQAQLAQNTGQNIAAQAALQAGQRGASSNVGLAARQIAENGAQVQQNAVGQAATLQAQQQLAAQQQLQNLAGTQVGQTQNSLSNLNNVTQNNQGQLLNALGGYNTNQVGSTSSQNSANASIANTNANNTSSALTSAASNLGPALTTAAVLFASGGEAKNVLAEVLSKKQMPDHMRSIAEIYHPKILKMAMGGMAEGAVVPGNPKVPGKNTTKNDVVPAMLTPKEIVLPLSVTQAKNPGEAAKAFVEHIKGSDSKESDSDFKSALKKHVANRKTKK